MKKIAVIIFALSPLLLAGCWEVAAARAAKKRTGETGYVVGTLERETGVDDPLGRKQKSITDDNSDADKK